ncbi:MAG TPA: lipopolysaccharide heptosyltransferase II [Gemmatimonadaceae bacterium]|nr:lipopolysaccharide heptosyltransferase II [Gemmatimonadaceae bacterium]
MSSLVIQTSFLGDVVLTTPLIAELATRGPVDVVVTPAAAPLLANHPAVRDVIVFDKRGGDDGIAGLWRFARTLRTRADGSARGTGAAYLAQGSLRSAAVAMLAGIRDRVGFSTSAGRLLYTRRSRYRADRHHAERLWRLAAGDDAPDPAPEMIRPRLYPGEGERAAIDALLRDVPRDGARLLALAPGSIWGTKRWPHFPALAARMAPLYRLVVVGGSEDAALAQDIARAAGPERVVDATGRFSLLASTELLSRCAALVTNDSAPQHLASAAGTPTLAIFGPTVPAFGFGPLAPRHATIGNEQLDCRPCDSHGPMVCPLGHFKCMKELAVEHVTQALNSLLVP